MSRNPKFIAALEEMRKTHDSKNEDYATADNPYSNFEEAADAAGISVDEQFMALLGVKWARLRQLLSGKTPNHESLADNLKDFANYAAIWYSYHLAVEEEPCPAISDQTGLPCLLTEGHPSLRPDWPHRSQVGAF